MSMFDELLNKAETVPVTAQLGEQDYRRLMDLQAATAVGHRGALVKALIVDALAAAEVKLGGVERVAAQAVAADPEGKRYERKTRHG